MKDAVRRLGFWKGTRFMGIFRWQHWQAGEFFSWGKPAGLPCQIRDGSVARFGPVRGDDGHDHSFITRDFNRGCGKENGTIPFYHRFFDRINTIIKMQNYRSHGAVKR